MQGSREAALAALVVMLAGTLGGCTAAQWKEMLHPRKVGMRSPEGAQQGVWTYWYDLERQHLQAKGSYQNDRQVGPWTYWYENGNKEWEGSFAKQRLAGPSAFWYREGGLRAQGLYADGLEEGEWTFWNADGKTSAVGDFERGKRSLRWRYLRPDDELEAEGYWLADQRVGVWKFRTDAGEPREKLFPLPRGWRIVREAWPDGSVKREGFSCEGRPAGRWALWHENGGRKLAGAFRDGVASGEWIAWDEDGSPLASGEVKNGQAVGDWKVWSEASSSGSIGEARAASFSTVDGRVTRWLSEAQAPAGAFARDVVEAGMSEPDPQILAESEHRPRIPIRAQPWTVNEEANIDYLVKRYTVGAQTARPPGGSRGHYRASAGPQRGDTRRSEPWLGKKLPCKRLLSGDGVQVDLDSYKGKKRVVLVIMRGFAGMVCVYCTTQTKALAQAEREFERLNTEVLVVYPGPEDGLAAFQEAYERLSKGIPPPYARLADPDFKLVDPLDLRSDLAIPSTFILDEQGIVRWAYVGKTAEDRPSTEMMIKALEALSP